MVKKRPAQRRSNSPRSYSAARDDDRRGNFNGEQAADLCPAQALRALRLPIFGLFVRREWFTQPAAAATTPSSDTHQVMPARRGR